MKTTMFAGSRAPPHELSAHQPDELAVGREVALPQLARLHHQTPRPFEARCDCTAVGARAITPASTSKLPPTPMITGTCSGSRCCWQNTSLNGRRHADEQEVRRRCARIVLDDGVLVGGGEVAVARRRRSRGPDSACGNAPSSALHDLRPRAEEVDAQAGRGCRPRAAGVMRSMPATRSAHRTARAAAAPRPPTCRRPPPCRRPGRPARSAASRRIRHRCDALAVVTMCVARGPRHQARQPRDDRRACLPVRTRARAAPTDQRPSRIVSSAPAVARASHTGRCCWAFERAPWPPPCRGSRQAYW